MDALLDAFANFFSWMESLPPGWAYVTLFVIAYGENVVPPIPGDMVVVFGGYLAGVGQLDLFAVILLSTIGGAAGFMSMYAVGWKMGDAAMDPDRLRWIPSDGFEKAQRWMQRYGFGVVAANRFLSGARSVISLTVGMAKMNPWTTLLWSTFSAAIWTGLIAYGGYAVGENWEIVVEWVRAYGRWMGSLLVIAALAWFARRWWKTRRAQAS